MLNLSYNPGQTVDLFLEVIGSGVLVDADALPELTSVLVPNVPSTATPAPFIPDPNPLLILPQAFTRVGTGIYFCKYILPKGGIALGTYLFTATYLVATVPFTQNYRVQVSSPNANYSIT